METDQQSVNQLVFATIAGSQVGDLVKALIQDGFYVTEIDSRGGFLHEATVSLLIGLDKTRLPRFLELLRESCHTRRQFIPVRAEAPFLELPTVMVEAEIGGATVYVFDVERFEQL
jgi:uncharacterized protein YaaQ